MLGLFASFAAAASAAVRCSWCINESSSVLQKKDAPERFGAVSHHPALFSAALPTCGSRSRALTKIASPCAFASSASRCWSSAGISPL